MDTTGIQDQLENTKILGEKNIVYTFSLHIHSVGSMGHQKTCSLCMCVCVFRNLCVCVSRCICGYCVLICLYLSACVYVCIVTYFSSRGREVHTRGASTLECMCMGVFCFFSVRSFL